jgi:transcriptional regulator with XRE-family HTH domain
MSSTPYTWPVPKTSQALKTVPTPDEKAFGRKLQEIRKRRGLSQAEVAQRLGIHQSLISQYERGYLRLHGALLVRLAQVLQTTPDQILAVKDAPSEADQLLDRRFLRRLHKIDKLSAHQKKILLGTIDAFLSKVS